MEERIAQPDDSGADIGGDHAAPLVIDTTQGSILHRLMRRPSGKPRSALTAYVVAAVATYGLLSITVGVTALLPAFRHVEHRLPFHSDWNILWMFLVSFPTLVVLTVRDDAVLRMAMDRIQVDGILTFPNLPETRATFLVWEKGFRWTNLAAYAAGAVAGFVIAYFNFNTYTKEVVGFWIATERRLLPVGYVFLLCIGLFYWLVSVFVIRNVAISLFLREVVKRSRLSMLPAHPDHCGGLRPIGTLGLRNQYVLTVCGVNVATLAFISYAYFTNVPDGLRALIIAAGVAYVILGPVVFMGPLLSFRKGMVATKAELLSEVAQRLRVELRRLRSQLPEGQITKDDEEFVDRLRKIGAVIEELPVWPFDSGTLKRFVTAYVIPLIAAAGTIVLEVMLKGGLAQLVPPAQ